MNWLNPPQDRSIQCNGDVIRFYRTRLEWTQQELADAAGYTKRVIAKAESGGSLAPETIAVISKALSINDQSVFPEDITSSPREMAAALLRANTEYEADAVQHCKHLFSDQLEVYIPGGPDNGPLSGLYRGIDAYDKYTRTFFHIFQRPDKELARNTAVISADGNRAVLPCFEKLGNEFIPPDSDAGPLSLFLLFSRGKIIKIQYLFDTMTTGLVITAWREKREREQSHKYLSEVSTMQPWSKENREGK